MVQEVLQKDTRTSKMRSVVASYWKLTTTIENIMEADPLTSIWEVTKELNISHFTLQMDSLVMLGLVVWPVNPF